MIKHLLIDVARDFRPDLGFRFRIDGPGSGEEFREDVLLPAFEKAESVTVDLGGVDGIGGGWMTEAFGGLVRELGSGVFGRIRLVSERHPERAALARVAMSDAAVWSTS